MQSCFESLRWVISSHFVYCTLICPAEKQTNTFFLKILLKLQSHTRTLTSIHNFTCTVNILNILHVLLVF